MKPALNQNKSLITVLNTHEGYTIFDIHTLKQVSEDDDFQSLLGKLKFFIPLHSSSICFFVGDEDNINFPSDQIIVWNEAIKKKIGIILLYGVCDDLKVRSEILLCSVNSQILIYDIFSLELILILEDCDPLSEIITNDIGNPCYIINKSKINQSQIKICKIKMNKQPNNQIEDYLKNNHPNKNKKISYLYKATHKIQYAITTFFEEILSYNISPLCDFLVVIGTKNKIHIYDLLSFQVIFCFKSPYEDMTIISVSFSDDDLLSVGYINGEVFLYKFFSDSSKLGTKCNCLTSFEDDLENSNKLFKRDSIFDKISSIASLLIPEKNKSYQYYLKLNTQLPYLTYFTNNTITFLTNEGYYNYVIDEEAKKMHMVKEEIYNKIKVFYADYSNNESDSTEVSSLGYHHITYG